MKPLLIFAIVVVVLVSGCTDFGSLPEIPVPELTVHSDTTNEGDIAECEFELSFEAPRPVTIIYTFEGITATAGQDFEARTDTVTIEASDGSGHAENHIHVGLEFLQDDQIEPLEEVTIKILSATNAVITQAEATCVILDDDGVPFVTIRDTSAVEGEMAQVTVELNKAGILPVIFDFSLVAGSATAPADFIMASGRDTIPPGQLSAVLSIVTSEDAVFEPIEEFTIRLTALSNGMFLDSMATCTILDDDAPSFASHIQPLLLARCAITGCHGGSSAEGGLNLGSATYHAVFHASGGHGAAVVPGSAGTSSLYFKATTSPQFGSRMPPGGPYISTTDLNKLRDWINAGAPDN